MNKMVALCFAAASCFASWPFLTRKAGLSMVWTSLTINFVTALVALGYYYFHIQAPPKPSALVMAVVAGVINGIGFLCYSYLNAGEFEVSKVLVLIDIFLPLIALCLGAIFLGEPITVHKCIGVGFALLGVYFIVK